MQLKFVHMVASPVIISETIANLKENLTTAILMQIFEIFSKTALQNSQILHTNSPWPCAIKVCSNGGTIEFISKIKAKDNNITNLIQTFDILL